MMANSSRSGTPRRLRRRSLPRPRMLGSVEEMLLRKNELPASLGLSFMSVPGWTLDIQAVSKTPQAAVSQERLRVPFTARCVQESPLPWSACVDVSSCNFGAGYMLPRAGLIQLVVHNPENTPVYMWRVKYDLFSMPKKHKTLLRQRHLAGSTNCGDSGGVSAAIQFQLVAPTRRRLYMPRLAFLFPPFKSSLVTNHKIEYARPPNPQCVPLSKAEARRFKRSFDACRMDRARIAAEAAKAREAALSTSPDTIMGIDMPPAPPRTVGGLDSPKDTRAATKMTTPTPMGIASEGSSGSGSSDEEEEGECTTKTARRPAAAPVAIPKKHVRRRDSLTLIPQAWRGR